MKTSIKNFLNIIFHSKNILATKYRVFLWKLWDYMGVSWYTNNTALYRLLYNLSYNFVVGISGMFDLVLCWLNWILAIKIKFFESFISIKKRIDRMNFYPQAKKCFPIPSNSLFPFHHPNSAKKMHIKPFYRLLIAHKILIFSR